MSKKKILAGSIAAILLILLIGFLSGCATKINTADPQTEVLTEEKPQSLMQIFDKPDNTIEYHFLITDPSGMTENNMAEYLNRRLIEPIKPYFSVEPLSKPRWGTYIDSRDRTLDKANLILRVRPGQITVKARHEDPEKLIDLYDTGIKKYEIDFFGSEDYSISADIKFTNEQFDASGDWTTKNLITFIKNISPPLYEQLKPYVKDGEDLLIPGRSVMYGGELKFNPDHPLASKVISADLSVWFFPPTGKSIIEIEFLGYMEDRPALNLLRAELIGYLKGVGLYNPVQQSKTSKYFDNFLQ